MTNYENQRNYQIVTFVKEENNRVYLEGKEGLFDVSTGTFKRWYKATDKQRAVAKSAVTTLEKPEVISTPKQLKHAVETKVKVSQKADVKAANENLVNSLLQYGQTKGCEIIAHDVDVVLRYGNRNIVKTIIGKTTATMFFNYKSIPGEYFEQNKLQSVPAEWKWALGVKVKVCEANQKTILDLIDFGVKFINDKAIAKENVLKAKAEKKAAKTKK